MHSTKKGCYRVNFYGDDGIRLKMDDVWVFNRWVLQGPTSYNEVLLNFTGNSNLIFDYYENGGQNVAAFRNLVKLNSISTETEITQCPEDNIETSITANSLSLAGSTIGHSYSWQFQEEGGVWQNVTGQNTETSCNISDIFNDSDIQKIFYFRRRVIFSQGSKWGASSKNYLDVSAIVKVIVPVMITTNSIINVN